MNAWTDYPIAALGDEPGNVAPVRSCRVLSYDRDKYCMIAVDRALVEVKAGYLYTRKGRFGVVPPVATDDLLKLPRRDG